MVFKLKTYSTYMIHELSSGSMQSKSMSLMLMDGHVWTTYSRNGKPESGSILPKGPFMSILQIDELSQMSYNNLLFRLC